VVSRRKKGQKAVVGMRKKGQKAVVSMREKGLRGRPVCSHVCAHRSCKRGWHSTSDASFRQPLA